jgi:Fe2+ or Zn2+ uptake regulation protein
VLEEIGVIGSKHWSESPTRYDLNLEPHLDIRCERCGEVSEIPGVEFAGLEERIRNNTPYEVTRATVVVEGLCPACSKGE